MDITCPNCQFSRTVPDDRIPTRSVNATCPQCGTKFRFRRPEDMTEEPQFELSSPEPVAPEAPRAAAPRPEAPQDAPQAAPQISPEAAPQATRRAVPPEPAAAAQPSPSEEPDTRPAAPTKLVFPDETDPIDEPGAAPRREPGGSDIWQRLDDLGKSHPGREPENGSYHFQDAPGADGEPVVPVPFEDLDRFGFFGGMWETIRRVLLKPGLFFGAMPLTGSMARPIAFYMLLGELAYLFVTVWNAAGLDPVALIKGTDAAQGGDVGFYASLSANFLMLLVWPLFLFVSVYFNAALVHVLLLIFRAGGSGFKATLRVCCYANASAMLMLVPVVGVPLTFLWQTVVTVAGLRAVHRASLPFVILAYSFIFAIGLLALASPFLTPPAVAPPTM